MRSASLTFLVIFAVLQTVLAQYPTVTVGEGVLRGKTVQFSENEFINVTKDVDLFLGVPFADPPGRFEGPRPKTPWNGEWNATQFSAACQQPASPYYPTMSEDCLYLNVYAPSDRGSGLAVMLFIHGGGFSIGSAMGYQYYGVPLVAVGEDIILVTFNYRLGIFAQMSTEDDEAPGGYGMLDQVAALKWVYENIEAFGGDKERITIFGESAGSASVSFHLLSKLSRGYFSQAILQSGTCFSDWAFLDNPQREKDNSRNLGLAFGCDASSSASLVACLKTIDAVELDLKATEIYQAWYPVTLDGTFLEETPTDLYAKGDFLDVPMMIGFNKDEGTLNILFFLPDAFGSLEVPMINRTLYEAYVNGHFTVYYGNDDDIVTDAALHEYTDWKIADDPSGNFFQSLVDFWGDALFGCPSDRVARTHADAGGVVFKYFMTHAPTRSIFQGGDTPPMPWLGAGHGEDLIFVFGMPFIEELREERGNSMTDEEKALSVKFMQFWTNFAKSGDPSRTGLGSDRGTGVDSWPQFTIPELMYKELSLDLGEGRAVRARQCHFWNEYLPELQSFTNTIDADEQEWRESYADWQGDMAEWRRVFEEYQQEPTCN